MKKLLAVLLMAAAAVLSAPANAASASASVPITINLTSACVFSTAPAGLTFAYNSFQATASTATGGALAIKCTTSLPYKVGFSSAATPPTTLSVAAAATNLQLAYSLGLTGTTSGTGTGGTAISLTVTGSMAAGQSGTCATATCTGSDPQTIYIVY